MTEHPLGPFVKDGKRYVVRPVAGSPVATPQWLAENGYVFEPIPRDEIAAVRDAWLNEKRALDTARRSKAAELYQGGRAATLAIFSQLPLGVQAQFAPVLDASDAAAKSGDIAKAKLIIETCVVPEPLAATQAALVAALTPFVARAAALAVADTVEEVQAV